MHMKISQQFAFAYKTNQSQNVLKNISVPHAFMAQAPRQVTNYKSNLRALSNPKTPVQWRSLGILAKKSAI
jgi:hypothetical protein